METTTPVSTNLASWLRRNCCQREWVTAGFTYCDTWVKICIFVFSLSPVLTLRSGSIYSTVFSAYIHGFLPFRWLTCTRWLQKCGRKGSQRAMQSTGVGWGKKCYTQSYHCEASHSPDNFNNNFTYMCWNLVQHNVFIQNQCPFGSEMWKEAHVNFL